MHSKSFTPKEYTSNITLNILSKAISNIQQEDTHRMLTLYRDNTPGAYIPAVSGIMPTIVELKLPAIGRRDTKLLLRYPEPRRTATWIRMSFVACDEYIASSGVLYKAYMDALQPLIALQNDESTQKTPRDLPKTPLLCPDAFSALLEKQIKGYEPYSVNGRSGRDRRVITRGARTRTEALTFPSTNRKRGLCQLKYYRKKGDLVYPEGDPEKRSTFSKWLAHDPLFMLPRETQSPFTIRMIADSARPDGATYYDGKGTEDAGFPGVSIAKKGKDKNKGKSTERNQQRAQTASTGGATLLGQTGPNRLASVQIDPLSVGGFGSIVRNAKDESDAQRYMEEQRKLEIQRDLATLEDLDKQRYLEIQRELDTQRALDTQKALAKQRYLDMQRELDALMNEVTTEDRKEDATVQPVVTHAVESNELEDNVSRVRKNIKPLGSFEAVLGIRQAACKRLGNQKGAMIVNLTQLAASAEDHTSDATRNNYPEGAIGFIEQVEELTAEVAYRRMHELQKIRAKVKLNKASKVVDAVTASVSPTFMELALRPRTN